MRKLILLLALLVGWHRSLQAQDAHAVFQARADSLRAAYTCAPVEWPELPPTGRRVFRSALVDSAGNMSPADSAKLARPDIVVPQYAYIYDDLWAGCLPVIIVQAEGRSLGWVAVLPPPPALGAIHDAFVDLLGVEPPTHN